MRTRAELLRARSEKLDQAEKILKAAQDEDRALTDEDRGQVETLTAEVRSIDEDLKAMDSVANLRGVQHRTAPVPQGDPGIGMSDREARTFSIHRAIRAAVTEDWREAEFEREASETVAKKLGQEPRSFYIPHDVLAVRQEQRIDISKALAGHTGEMLIAEDFMASSFIDLLRNRLAVRQAGARVLAGLVGDVAIPKISAGSTGSWLADEDTAASESSYTFTQVTLSPATVSAWVGMTRTMLMQSTPDVEDIVRDDLSQSMAIAIDLAALHGSGSSGQPTGLASTSGIGTVVGGTDGLAPTWAHIVEFETDVAVANADVGSMAYVTNPKVRGKLKQTDKASSFGQFIWGDSNTLNGYRTVVSNQVSSTLTKGSSSGVCSAIFFGNWADLIVGMWGGLDILVDPFTYSTKGQILVIAFQSADIAVRHAASFSVMLDALTA